VSDDDFLAALTPGKGGVYINLHAQPGARREKLCGMHGDALKLAVRQAAQDGKANAAIVALMADLLGCAKRDVEVTAGHTSRRKRLFVSGDEAVIKAKIKVLLQHV